MFCVSTADEVHSFNHGLHKLSADGAYMISIDKLVGGITKAVLWRMQLIESTESCFVDLAKVYHYCMLLLKQKLGMGRYSNSFALHILN